MIGWFLTFNTQPTTGGATWMKPKSSNHKIRYVWRELQNVSNAEWRVTGELWRRWKLPPMPSEVTVCLVIHSSLSILRQTISAVSAKPSDWWKHKIQSTCIAEAVQNDNPLKDLTFWERKWKKKKKVPLGGLFIFGEKKKKKTINNWILVWEGSSRPSVKGFRFVSPVIVWGFWHKEVCLFHFFFYILKHRSCTLSSSQKVSLTN